MAQLLPLVLVAIGYAQAYTAKQSGTEQQHGWDAQTVGFSQHFAPEMLASTTASNHWAVLIAGSAGYGNYRHQADVCHAYQILRRGGIPEEQIIVLMMDDIAHNPENPVPGKVFNKPTEVGVPGVDVYGGCAIDYSGDDVTPFTFTKVLTGDAEALKGVGSGKVLRSTDKDRVFVNFVDHGGVGLIGFPKETMHASELVGALQQMHDASMYKELVFYLEACESGSMFQELPTNIAVYATSAANAHESSWGTYCMPHSMVDGVNLHTCLGDLYSVNWMEDTDTHDGIAETLLTQFETVKRLTTRSHVMAFGNSSFTTEPTADFEGDANPMITMHTPLIFNDNAPQRPSDTPTQTTTTATNPAITTATPPSAAASTALPSRDAALASAFSRFVATGSDAAAAELISGVQQRQRAKATFDAIVRRVTRDETQQLPSYDGVFHQGCHYAAHKAYVSACGEWTEAALAHSATLARLCAHTHNEHAEIVAAINAECSA